MTEAEEILKLKQEIKELKAKYQSLSNSFYMAITK